MSWSDVLTFAYTAFCLPEKSRNRKETLTAIIKRNVARSEAILVKPKGGTGKKDMSNEKIKKAVENKLMDGDVNGAIRVLSSEDVIAPTSREILDILLTKHPDDDEDANYPEEPTQMDSVPEVSCREVLDAIRSFPNGSSGGIDGLRPQHLKDILGSLKDESSHKLCVALSSLMTLILKGEVPMDICPILFGASLSALMKKDGGIRPIAVGNTLRRLAGKIVSRRVMGPMGSLLRPIQLGYGTRGGSEAVVHAVREAISAESGACSAMLKLDFSNAFNSIRRDRLLEEVKAIVPAYFNFVWQMYRKPSHLIFGEHLMLSKAGVQQGDPLGPLLFCLLVRKITEKLQSSTNLWYLDDGTICGDVMSVSRDLNLILRDGQALGLELNLSKCELFVYGGSEKERIEAIRELQKVSPNIRVPSREELSLLGAPLFDKAIPGAILEKKRQLEILSSRLSILSSHQALYLLKNCISFPRLLYVLRSSPAYRHSQELIEFDSAVRSALSMVTNTEMTDEAWMQASLPVKKGGVGVRRTEELALPAYLASIHSVHELISTIVPSAVLDELIMEPMAIWTQRVTVDPPLPIRRHIQKEWDNPIMEVRLQDLLTSADQKGKARLRAVATKESGCWLNALPVANVGNLLDDDSLRIAVSLRLGASICQPHTCRCGAAVDVYGLHGLCCRFSAGRHSRHGSLNEVLRRALSTAGVPAVLEPQGIERVDGKRPDGMTLVPWTQGKALVWDVTCVDTLAQSYVFGSSYESGTAANIAERNKVDKYRAVQGRYHFSPLGFETFGAWGSAAKDLVASVGKRMTIRTGDARCVDFLRQKFSIEIQRGNAASVLGTLPCGKGLDEVYYILRLRK